MLCTSVDPLLLTLIRCWDEDLEGSAYTNIFISGACGDRSGVFQLHRPVLWVWPGRSVAFLESTSAYGILYQEIMNSRGTKLKSRHENEHQDRFWRLNTNTICFPSVLSFCQKRHKSPGRRSRAWRYWLLYLFVHSGVFIKSLALEKLSCSLLDYTRPIS
jgi:hypothetical protein